MPKFKVCMGLYGLNAEQYLHEAIESVLSQDLDGVEVVLADDGSADRTHDIMLEYACRGTPDRPVRVNRHPARRGIGGQLNSICELSSADVIVLCGADDRSLPHRARATYDAWIESDERGHSISSAAVIIDESGRRTGHTLAGALFPGDLIQQVRNRCQGVYGAAQAMSRKSWQTFGPFIPRLFLEDNSIALRALLLSGATHVDDPLVEYRIHSKNSCRLPGGGADVDAFRRQCVWYHRESAVAYAQFMADLNNPAAEVVDAATLDELRRIAADAMGRELMLSQYYRGTLRSGLNRHACGLLARAHDVFKVWCKLYLPWIETRNARREIHRRSLVPY